MTNGPVTKSRSPALEAVVWTVLVLAILGIAGAFFWKRSNVRPQLPIYGQVQDFALTNQNGTRTTLEMLRGKVWLADIIFTRCTGPCPKLSSLLADLNVQLAAYPDLKLVSLTADPGFDTVEVLKTYAKDFKADSDRWFFLTGTKADLYKTAIDNLKLVVIEKEARERTSPEDLFVHSTLIALIDQQGRLRGYYEALEPDSPARLLAAVKSLLGNP
jgi:protein SCO1/2